MSNKLANKSTLSSNVNRPIRLWVAFANKYAWKPRQPSGTLEYFLLMAFHTLLLPHFSLLHFPLPHFQRPLRDNVTFTRTGSTHVAWTARHCGGGGGGGIETRTSRQHATRTCTSTYSQPRRDSACRLNMLLFPVLRLHQSSLHKLWTLTIGSCYCR